MKLLKQRCFDPSTLLPSRFIDLSTGLPVEGSLYWVIKWVNRVDIVVGVFLILILSRTRRHVRERSRIPETSCQG